MEIRREELTAGGKRLAKVKIPRGMFQGDVVPPLLFVAVMMPPNHVFKKCTGGFKFLKSQENINHALYITR